jgi:hypothetical protein
MKEQLRARCYKRENHQDRTLHHLHSKQNSFSIELKKGSEAIYSVSFFKIYLSIKPEIFLRRGLILPNT